MNTKWTRGSSAGEIDDREDGRWFVRVYLTAFPLTTMQNGEAVLTGWGQEGRVFVVAPLGYQCDEKYEIHNTTFPTYEARELAAWKNGTSPEEVVTETQYFQREWSGETGRRVAITPEAFHALIRGRREEA